MKILAIIVLGMCMSCSRSPEPPGVIQTSLWPSDTVPRSTEYNESRAVTLATEFVPNQDGRILAIKFPAPPDDGDPHRASLWTSDGELLAQIDVNARQVRGWQIAPLDRAISVEAGKHYLVAYTAPTGRYLAEDDYSYYPATPQSRVTAIRGLYSYGEDLPRNPQDHVSYFADIVFESTDQPQSVESSAESDPSSTFPASESVGVPAATDLTASGPVNVTQDGTLLDGLDISGDVRIGASNVTIRNCRITGSAYNLVQVASGLSGVLIENVDIVGEGLKGVEGATGVNGPVTLVASDISGVENGVIPTNGSNIVGNYIHGLASPGSPHYDGIQIDGGVSNIRIERNTIDLRNVDQTATVMIDNYFGPVSDILVSGNLLQGGSYTVYSDGQFSGGTISKVSFLGNRLGSGTFGYHSFNDNAPTWTGNTDFLSGANVE